MSWSSSGTAAGTTRHAAARRDGWLARTRSLSLSVAGTAAAASLVLGAAFAHALPGHARQAGIGRQAGFQGAGTQRGSGSGGTGKPGARQDQHPLSPPRQQPTSTPSAPTVVSGGS